MDDQFALLSNGNYSCRPSHETTTQGKIGLAAWYRGIAEVIPLSADELSMSVVHSCGVDYNKSDEKIIIFHTRAQNKLF